MKILLASILSIGLLTGAAFAGVFDDINASAPKSPFQQIQDTAPKSVFDTLNDTAPHSEPLTSEHANAR